MQDRKATFLRLLLNHYHKGPQESVLAPLPDEEAKAVSDLSVNLSNFDALLSTPLKVISKVHYSWLVDKIKEMPETSIVYLLGFLPPKQAEKIQSALKIKGEIPTFSPLMKRFVLSRIANDLPFKDTLPFENIPDSELSKLSQLSKQEIVQLIDFLGLYDLTEEMHNIVDKKLLENINNALTAKKKAYVKKCLLSKEKLVTNRLNLEYWDGDPAKLSKLLHHRGMVRLGYALCAQDESLVWYITHTLDAGRGNKLLRYINDKEIPTVTKTLREQVLNVIAFFNKESNL